MLDEIHEADFLIDLKSLMDIAGQLTRAQVHGETVSTEYIQRAFANHLDFLCEISLSSIKSMLGDKAYKEILDKIL